MAVIYFKPHVLSYYVPIPGYEDENGDYHQGGGEWEGEIQCDAVPAGKSEEREFEDGVVRSYSYTVTLPADCRTFAIGDRVRITHIGEISREYEVKGFHRWQTLCKIWV